MFEKQEKIKMANEQKYVPILRGIDSDKLMWVMAILNLFEIKFRLVRFCVKGKILTVREDSFMRVWDILNKPIGKFVVDDMSIETAAIDMSDDHPFFKTHLDADVLLSQAIELYEDELDAKRPKPEPDPLEGVPEITLTDETEITVPDEAEIVASNVLPMKKGDKVEVKVTPAEDEDEGSWLADGDGDDDDDEWGEEDPEPEPEQVEEENPMAQYANMPEGTEYTVANEVLKSKQMAYPKLKVPVQMFEIDSSNLAEIGYKPTKDDPTVVTFYTTFKTGMTYRYNPVAMGKAQSILSEAVRREIGFQEASAGSAFYSLIKESSEAGDIKCQRLDAENERWVEVLPKAARKAQLKEKNA